MGLEELERKVGRKCRVERWSGGNKAGMKQNLIWKFGKIVMWGRNEVEFGKIVYWGGMKYGMRG